MFCILTKSLLFAFLQTQVITPYRHNLLKGWREHIYFKIFSEYEIKQSSTWKELITIQCALQSFASKISNKSFCWETGNYAASLIVTSESTLHQGQGLLALCINIFSGLFASHLVTFTAEFCLFTVRFLCKLCFKLAFLGLISDTCVVE